MMTTETCQFCDRPGAEWTGPRHQRARMRYFRCDSCGHVWSVDRDLADTVVEHDAEPIERRVRGGFAAN